MCGSQSDDVCGRRCAKIACPGAWVKCVCNLRAPIPRKDIRVRKGPYFNGY